MSMRDSSLCDRNYRGNFGNDNEYRLDIPIVIVNEMNRLVWAL